MAKPVSPHLQTPAASRRFTRINANRPHPVTLCKKNLELFRLGVCGPSKKICCKSRSSGHLNTSSEAYCSVKKGERDVASFYFSIFCAVSAQVNPGVEKNAVSH